MTEDRSEPLGDHLIARLLRNRLVRPEWLMMRLAEASTVPGVRQVTTAALWQAAEQLRATGTPEAFAAAVPALLQADTWGALALDPGRLDHYLAAWALDSPLSVAQAVSRGVLDNPTVVRLARAAARAVLYHPEQGPRAIGDRPFSVGDYAHLLQAFASLPETQDLLQQTYRQQRPTRRGVRVTPSDFRVALAKFSDQSPEWRASVLEYAAHGTDGGVLVELVTPVARALREPPADGSAEADRNLIFLLDVLGEYEATLAPGNFPDVAATRMRVLIGEAAIALPRTTAGLASVWHQTAISRAIIQHLDLNDQSAQNAFIRIIGAASPALKSFLQTHAHERFDSHAGATSFLARVDQAVSSGLDGPGT